MPDEIRKEMEGRLGLDFSDVRIHTDAAAGLSAEAVGAHAYTVGRHIVFAAGRFEPASAAGRTLIAHELAHASAHSAGAREPRGALRVSSPAEPAERHAARVAEGAAPIAAAPSAGPAVFRSNGGTVALTSARMNHDRVTVPPETGLAFSIVLTPPNATGVTFAMAGDNATIHSGTTISAAGVVTVAAAQQGGSAHVTATQRITQPDGAWTETTHTAPFVFAAVPTGITSTTANAKPSGYGGEFTHTFGSPAGGQTALELSHVNERFAAATGTALALTSNIGSLNITVNDPNSASAGWDLDSSGTMAGPDHVTWSDTFSARSFVANASNPSPANRLPQAFTAAQQFRNLSYPSRIYGAAAVATTTHRRAFEDRGGSTKAVTSAKAPGRTEEVVQDYAGPTIFRGASAAPGSIPAVSPAPPGGTAPAPSTSTVSVVVEGIAAAPSYSVRPPDLGCTIDAQGVLTPGTTAGTVIVRAGDATNYDETTVTIMAPQPAPQPNSPGGAPDGGASTTE